MSHGTKLDDPYDLADRLAALDPPPFPDRRVRDADALLAALVDHADAQGRYHAHPALMRRLFWWENVTTDRILAWRQELEDRGDLTIAPLAKSCYGDSPIWVATIQRRKRFQRWAGRRPIPEGLRIAVYTRDGYTCVTCGTTENLSLDHIHPHSLRGEDTYENLQTMCRSCNSRKGARV